MKLIIVEDHDPQWAERFERLRAHVWPAIQEHAVGIEHVGSTAVPGLAAKPVIDMTIVVADEAHMAGVVEGLATLGYCHRGDLGVPGREAFLAPADLPKHHLYACVEGNLGLRNHLAVRDHLRSDPEAVRAYGELKKELAVRFRHDIDGYIEGKSAFLQAVLARGDFSSAELDSIQGVNRKPAD